MFTRATAPHLSGLDVKELHDLDRLLVVVENGKAVFEVGRAERARGETERARWWMVGRWVVGVGRGGEREA